MKRYKKRQLKNRTKTVPRPARWPQPGTPVQSLTLQPNGQISHQDLTALIAGVFGVPLSLLGAPSLPGYTSFSPVSPAPDPIPPVGPFPVGQEVLFRGYNGTWVKEGQKIWYIKDCLRGTILRWVSETVALIRQAESQELFNGDYVTSFGDYEVPVSHILFSWEAA